MMADFPADAILRGKLQKYLNSGNDEMRNYANLLEP